MINFIRSLFAPKQEKVHPVDLDRLSVVKGRDTIIGYRCEHNDGNWIKEGDAHVVLYATEEFKLYGHDAPDSKISPIHFGQIIEGLEEGEAFALGVLAYSRFYTVEDRVPRL